MSEKTQLPYRTGLYVGFVTPKDNIKIDKVPLQRLCLRKKEQTKKKRKEKLTGVTCEVVIPPRQAPCNVSRETKDCRVVQFENWVSQLNIRTELGLYLEFSHPKTMSKLRKAPCIKATAKRKKLNYFLTKNSTYDVLRSAALILKTTLSLQENHWFVATSFIIVQ